MRTEPQPEEPDANKSQPHSAKERGAVGSSDLLGDDDAKTITFIRDGNVWHVEINGDHKETICDYNLERAMDSARKLALREIKSHRWSNGQTCGKSPNG